MKILHLMAFRFWSGPAETVFQLALSQRAAGHTVYVAIDQSGDPIQAEEAARPYFENAGLLLSGNYTLSPRDFGLSTIVDIQFLTQSEFDVMHCHTTHDHMLASFSARLRRSLRPKVIRSFHKPVKGKTPLLVTDGYTAPHEGFDSRMPPDISNAVLPPLVSDSYMPALDKLSLKQKLGCTARYVVGMVSTFKESRKHRLGLDAFKLLLQEVPEAELLLIGDGELKDEIQGDVIRKGLSECVHLVGYKEGADYIEILQSLDLVWVLGLGNDWSGRAAAQARACGVKVVAVDIGGLPVFANALVAEDARDVAQKTKEVLSGGDLKALHSSLEPALWSNLYGV